ncbi:MAG: tRNA (adenosine(37)-N6)-dimethylallyltransferase MiaA [Oscillospiraceae bacterium]|nr:tRNA (adenosine(37)-N6)-dimethylallyltransferase MiaA [Oscillospiraceae bacterium]
MSAPELIAVCGPTASGKTRLGIELARALDGEIVSADSMQVYRGMDVGTAKASAAERAAVPHHMLDVADPRENYSVARWTEAAGRCCDDILSRGKLPIVVGGTGLYIDSLLSGRDFALERGSGALRERLEAEYERLGPEALHERLRRIDPERAGMLAPGDRRRVLRALEVYELTGETITAHDARTRAQPPRYRAKRIVLSFADREELYRRIDARVDAMVAAGLFEEVAGLLAQGLDASCTAMQAIGYKEAALAVRGSISREEAAARIKQASRRYAKRQLTWFRRAPDALWIEWRGEPDFARALERVLDNWEN